MADVSGCLRAKRKRGRPRKDSNLSREGSLQPPENSALLKTQILEKTTNDSAVDSLVGSVVYGVIEGSFDAGYLISVRIGNHQTPFRGVVFQPKKFVPVTAANDIAPQAKMHHRREFSIPLDDNPNKTAMQPVQASKQAVLRTVLPSAPPSLTPYSSSNHTSFMVPEPMTMRTSSCSNMGAQMTMPKSPYGGACKQFSYIHPPGSLRMVEEDEVMQAFEVSTSSGGSKNNIAIGGDAISESLPKAVDQENKAHGKATESGLGSSMLLTHNHLQGSGSNAELQHGLMERMPRSTFEIQQDEIIRREMEHPSNQYYNELRSPDVNFCQNLFTHQSQPNTQEPNKSLAAGQFHPGDPFYDSVSKSPNLKLDLAFSAHEKASFDVMKNTNMGYHQALVAGNPLLLPPDLTDQPLEFMMQKPKSPPHCSKTPQENSMELESRAGERLASPSAASSSYKLELVTPQTALNIMPATQTNSSGGGISNMDWPAGSYHHQSDPSATEQS